MSATFVGTVPQGSLTNTLPAGYSAVGSIVPISGDLATGSIPNLDSFAASGDYVYYFSSALQGYAPTVPFYEFGAWSSDPTTTNVAEGFLYYNDQGSTETWVETFSINP
jgi:hypothetical protein